MLVYGSNHKNPPLFQRKFNETGFKYRGFINITEFGLGYRKQGPINSEEVLIELRTVNGYQFNYNFSLGIGLGATLATYGTSAIKYPITLDARIASGEGKNTSVLGISGGFILNSYLNPIYILQPTIGLRHYVSENTAMVISLGPKMLLQGNTTYYRNLTGKDVAFFQIVTLNFGYSF
jgi:hypothetical protein